MNKQAYDMGFIKACSQYGITDRNQIEAIYAMTNQNMQKNAAWTDALNNPYITGAAGAGLGAGLGALVSPNDRLGGALVGGGLGGGLGALGGTYAPDIMNYFGDMQNASAQARGTNQFDLLRKKFPSSYGGMTDEEISLANRFDNPARNTRDAIFFD